MKMLLAIPRPCVGMATCPPMYSFPSNHAAAIFAFALVVSMNIRNWKVWLSTGALAFLVSASRIALDVHTPVDIVGGAVVGIASAVVVQKIYRRIYRIWVRKLPKG